MVLNAAVQMLREADELKKNILKFKSGTSMLQERSLWAMQQQLQKVYQKVLVLDLDYALDKKVEQDLWNVGFKQQIEALQAISKDRKNPLRAEGQAMLSWVLQAAAGFYLCLLHQICTAFKLDLPFRRRASLLGWVSCWGAAGGDSGPPAPPAAARYVTQHCLVHLGDLARYRQQLRQAHTFYRHALVVSAHSGQPYNQLALVSWRRGSRLLALYWHVRSLLVRAPFPPAPANLARTLAAAAHAATTAHSNDLPVLPGVTSSFQAVSRHLGPATASFAKLDSSSYIGELIRALHFIHTVDQLETAATIVESLNSSLSALVATDSFDSMTLIKMACVIIWAVHSSTDGLASDVTCLSEGEAKAAALSYSLAGAATLAMLLPAYTLDEPPEKALPALKVWLQWAVSSPVVLRSAAWSARPQLWPALAHTANKLADAALLATDKYDSVPLPEDEELHGFLPLEPALKELKFAHHAAWDAYGGRLPDLVTHSESPCEVSSRCTPNPGLEHQLRARRLVLLVKQLAHLRPGSLSFVEEDGKLTFTAPSIGTEALSLALAELATLSCERDGISSPVDSEDDTPRAKPPVVISEADFREKVREKRVGILKPQGSLERAREERAMANTQDDQVLEEPDSCDDFKGDDRKEIRKPRVNIAMAAIMRKQEETNKQVKFVTPPPVLDAGHAVEQKDQEKPKVVQPKPIKSLANLPIGKKTGGILSLKDKSAGYPHLVNTEPEKKEEDKKKESKPNSTSQNYQPKRQEHPPSPNWTANTNVTAQNFNEPRTFQKNYGIQANLNYNPNFQTVNNQGIRLPVVNPKEIDVRTAALQKQNARQEMFHDSKSNYQISGDKKNFMNDLPPRFANQYRYWQNAQDNQMNDNKFRDDSIKSSNLFSNQQRSWNPAPENYQPNPWWKPENPPPNFNNFAAPTMNLQTNYYSPLLPNPYQMPSYNQMQNTQEKLPNLMAQPSYMQSAIGQPQLQTLQNLVSSPNFSSSLNNFGSYAPAVGYDSSMYPQFNKTGYPPLQLKMMDKYQGNKEMEGLGFGSNALEMQRTLNFDLNNDAAKNADQIGLNSSVPAVTATNTYSLFSCAGAPGEAAWGALSTAAASPASPALHPHQSLWSGPGPSPLERLLEQQKQKQPPAPQ